jgi:DNA-directed RNA polymerase specialized sigma24 family protein
MKKHPHPIQKSEARQAFDAGMQALFEARNLDASNLCAAIQRMLYQFRLSAAYDVKDILVEVYARGVRLAEQGEQFRNLYAWVRRSAYNVVREFRRELDKVCYTDLDEHPCLLDRNPISEQMFKDDLLAMRQAFRRLNPEERKILRFRIMHDLSWRDVGWALVATGNEPETEGNLRQMGFRALKKLRKFYEEEAQKVKSDFDQD